MTRRIISIFLIICMVVGLTPISVVAEEGNPGQTSESFTTQNEDYESATPSEAEEEPETEEPQTEVPQETTAQPEQLTEPEVITEPAAMPFDFEAATPAQALTAGVDPEIEYLAPDTFAFNAADEGYSFIAPLQIRINNIGETSTGTLDIVLTGSGKDDYSITKTSLPSIGAGQSDYFNVSPKTGLTTGDYTATVTVWANGVELKSTDLSFTVTPAGAKYPVEIRTYIDNIPSDMDGVVVLRNNQTTVEASKTDTGIYKTTAANGTYDIYVDGVDTNKIIAISNGATIVEIDYYTVSFSTSYAGTATGSSINATAGGTSIANGTKVVKGTPVTITATGAGAASYTYAWSGDGTNSQTTQSLTVASLSGTINAVCAVTGVGVMPTDPDYKIGNNPYLWTGSDQTIVLSGNNETLSILKPPSAVIRIDVRSEDLSTVTIEGNSIPCDKTYIEVYNDITLNLVDLTITAPDKTGVESSAVMLNKDDSESDQMKINVSGICNLTGSNWGSGIRSIHDQDLLISGSGTLNVTGGSTTDSNLAGGLGIDMEGYTYAMNQGARLAIDGGVTVNATGGSGQSNNGGTGIRVSWGSIRIGDADITATGGDSSSANYWGARIWYSGFLPGQ
ncbi:hypothetical protein [Lacrimispora xylanisolvens]|uniref:hypothetical protein n=1 Tax=Lacrimispora xylanisolvens TaxID=384636 RepID=UPI002402CB6E